MLVLDQPSQRHKRSMTPPRPPLKGRKLGDRRVVVNRPHSAFFRYAGPGVMVAKAAASAPTTAFGRRAARIRAIVFGQPLTNAQEIGERLSKKLALPISWALVRGCPKTIARI